MVTVGTITPPGCLSDLDEVAAHGGVQLGEALEARQFVDDKPRPPAGRLRLIHHKQGQHEDRQTTGERRPGEVTEPTPLVDPRPQEGVECRGIVAVRGHGRPSNPRRSGSRRKAEREHLAQDRAMGLGRPLGEDSLEQDLTEQAIRPRSVTTFQERVEWCRRYHKAWTDGKPGPVYWMNNQLEKHTLPRFGSLPIDAINETTIQELVADLKCATFERRKPNGDVIKTYRLSHKSVLNIVGIVKRVLRRKVWLTWELDLGKTGRPRPRYFTEEELKRIMETAPPAYRTLFALLGATGMRIGEAAGLHLDDLDLDNAVIHVRRSMLQGRGNRAKD
jgi:hypothetical protein